MGLPVTMIRQQVELVAQQRRFDPVRRWLDTLTWDGTARLQTFLRDHVAKLASADGGNVDRYHAYLSEIGTRFMISAIARVMQPGCKADYVPVLEGPQGALKSTFVQTLGGEWTIEDVGDITDGKDSGERLQGALLVELGELDAFKRAGVTRVKQFITKTHDRYLAAYDRRAMSRPRSCVFIATTNEAFYLHDDTGNRRFWPVPTRDVIESGAIAAQRDQLWAEARYRYERGERWWIEDTEIERTADELRADRHERDPWDELLTACCANAAQKPFTTFYVLTKILGVPLEQLNKRHEMRVGSILRRLGWTRKRMRVDGKPTWIWLRKEQA